MLVGKWPAGHVSKQLCRPPAPPQTAAPVIIAGTIVRASVLEQHPFIVYSTGFCVGIT